MVILARGVTELSVTGGDFAEAASLALDMAAATAALIGALAWTRRRWADAKGAPRPARRRPASFRARMTSI